MKEIKFRAWDKKEQKMLIVTNLDWLKEASTGKTKESSEGYFGDNHRRKFSLDDCELMQYTGLKDKNGKEIYEGDILSLNYFEGDVVKVWIEYLDTLPYCCTIIKYSEGDWTTLGRVMKRDGEQFTCKIIGNIYENPELLK